MRLINICYESLMKYGFTYTFIRGLRSIKRSFCVKKYGKSLSSRRDINNVNQCDLNVKFSVLVPLYNTPKDYLIDMIDSVVQQVYTKWELCIVDGSDNKHCYIAEICLAKQESDKRIKYKKLACNMGISNNTNICLKMADGDYFALLDHDDILHSDALYEVALAIQKTNADFLYTDEATFKKNIDNLSNIYFKPDFAIDNLRANNYICHLSVFSKKLSKKVGYFNAELDGSQDFDMILRLSEQAEKIIHIPKVLYYWRIHAFSVSNDIKTKMYAVQAGQLAIEKHLKRLGIDAKVEKNSMALTIYKVIYPIFEISLVSIVVIAKNSDEYRQCCNHINQISTYRNFEIINYTNQNISKTKGRYLLFYHATKIILNKDWIQELLMHAQRQDVGAVGSKIYFKNNKVKHAGLILLSNIYNFAIYSHLGYDFRDYGYAGRLQYTQDVSAVAFHGLMIRKDLYMQYWNKENQFGLLGGFLDLCFSLRCHSYLIVLNPFVEFREIKLKYYFFMKYAYLQNRDYQALRVKWKVLFSKNDPYYNPNFNKNKKSYKI